MSNIFYYTVHEVIDSLISISPESTKTEVSLQGHGYSCENIKWEEWAETFFICCWDSTCLWTEPSNLSREETVEWGTCKGQQRKFYLPISSFRWSSFLITNPPQLTSARISVLKSISFTFKAFRIRRFPFSFGLSVLQGTFNEVQQSHGASES